MTEAVLQLAGVSYTYRGGPDPSLLGMGCPASRHVVANDTVSAESEVACAGGHGHPEC